MSDAKILCPTDFSPHSDLALDHAAIYARASGATVLIVHVQEVSSASGEGMLHSGVRPDNPQTLARRLEGIRPGDDVACEHRLLKGKPAQEILRVAKEEGVAMIVMGTQGRTGVSRLITGSVAEEVLRHADCPVLTVKVPH
jgi:nucleotide-binding universal stress UspA family protein